MVQEKQENVKEEELDKVLNQMDVLPDSDKDIVRIDSERFTFSNVEYKLIENHKEAFDLEMMENRYTDYLLKYDYIVGDISYEKLRLRGFYEDYRKGVPIDMKISNLEDYLVEYCSFGCQYFVFERVEKSESDPEPYFKKKRSNRSNKRQNNRNQQNQKRKNTNNQNRNKKNPSNKKSNQPQKNQKNFQVKKKENQQNHQNKKTSQNKKQETKNKENVSFKIRKKED
ncbi:MAG TPA: YutD family protein [Atopostipes sp.]|nr:YutD family protein [Atopostipes sp.]